MTVRHTLSERHCCLAIGRTSFIIESFERLIPLLCDDTKFVGLPLVIYLMYLFNARNEYHFLPNAFLY